MSAILLRQATAATVKLGPFLDPADGVTPKTALTITPALRKLSKNGAAFAATSDGSNATHDADGWYGCSLTTADTGTLGRLQLSCMPAGATPVWAEYEVVPAAVYDADRLGITLRGALHYGTAQGGGASALTLAAAASSLDDYYNGCDVVLLTGTGAPQVRPVQDYVGSSRGVVTDRPWLGTPPDATTVYCIMPRGYILSTLAEVSAAIGSAQLSGSLHSPTVRPTRDQALLYLERVFAHLANATSTTDTVKDVNGADLATLTYSPDKNDPSTRQRTS